MFRYNRRNSFTLDLSNYQSSYVTCVSYDYIARWRNTINLFSTLIRVFFHFCFYFLFSLRFTPDSLLSLFHYYNNNCRRLVKIYIVSYKTNCNCSIVIVLVRILAKPTKRLNGIFIHIYILRGALIVDHRRISNKFENSSI